MPKFLVTIHLKNGKTYQGIREAHDQYQLYQDYEAKIQQWDQYSLFQGLVILPMN
jgi:hypothetical protein